jgi:MFS family permease
MRLNYGWIIVGVGMVASCIGIGSLMSLGVFLQPIALAMGWSRAGISSAAMLGFISMGVGSMGWGVLSDRFGARVVVLAGGALLGFGLAAASQANSLLAFQLLFGGCVGLACGSIYVPLTTAAASWVTRNRSVAVALVSAGMGLGSTVVGPLSRVLIDQYDWRTAMLGLACLACGIILPGALLLRPPPATVPSASTKPATVSVTENMSATQALRTPQFAALALANFACCAAHSGPIFHMVSYAMDCGVTSMSAVAVFGTAGVAGLGGRLVFGLIADRVGARHVLVAGLAMQALSISLYPFARDVTSLSALAVLFGMSYGGVMPIYALLVREYFSGRIMGTVFGAVSMVATFGMAIGPLTGGWLYDQFGGYVWLYVGSFAIGLAAAGIALAVRPPRRSEAVLMGHGMA